MKSAVRIIIAVPEGDDRASLRQLLSRLGHEVVAVAGSDHELIEQCQKLAPDPIVSGTLRATPPL
jgi:CheY-like chemotaxis protein